MMRCLYVDDESCLLDVAKDFLEMNGDMVVDTASSVDDALKMMAGIRYDAVISDYQMPGRNGIEFLKHLRQKGNGIPFILFTGRGREEVVIEALRNGADHYIKKGGDPVSQYAELANMVSQSVRRMEAESAIRYNAARFRALIENTRDLVTIIDWSGHIIFTSPSVKNALGYTQEEVKGRSVFSFLHPDDRYVENALMFSALKDICGAPAEFRLRAKDGTFRWFRGSASGYLDEGDHGQMILYAWFIDDKKAIERELVLRDRAYEGLMEQVKDMVFVLDEVGRFTMVNRALCEFFGMDRAQLIGTNATVLIAPENHDMAISVITAKLRGRDNLTRHEYVVLDALGQRVKVEVRSAVMRSNGLHRIMGIAVPMGRGNAGINSNVQSTN